MSVDLRKHIVDLSKKAAFAANKHGIEGQRAQRRPDLSASTHARGCQRAPRPERERSRSLSRRVLSWKERPTTGRPRSLGEIRRGGIR